MPWLNILAARRVHRYPRARIHPTSLLTVEASRVGVEVTQLSQFTFEADGSLGNRTTQDVFGIRLLAELDAKVGPALPDKASLLIGLWVPVSNASRFKKGLTE